VTLLRRSKRWHTSRREAMPVGEREQRVADKPLVEKALRYAIGDALLNRVIYTPNF